MSTEIALWLATVLWLLVISLPITRKVWDKYTYWVMKNFGQERK